MGTCILPTISIGNVGQLAIDILITTLKCRHVGAIFHKAVVPLFGKNAFVKTSNQPSTAVDVYICDKHQLMLVQVRTAIVKRYQDEFIAKLFSWLNELKISKTVVLSSLDAVDRHDMSIGNPDQILYTVGEKLKGSDFDEKQLNEIGAKLYKQSTIQGAVDNVDEIYSGSGSLPTFLSLANELNGSFVALFIYCLEGDNRPQGHFMMSFLTKLLEIRRENNSEYRSKVPHSWSILDEKLDNALSMF